ncbi:MAG: ABC transporter ATP-binding protein [Pacificimonas sp.]|jgi:iron complex transport system ATP-binding protein|nr:ABC transporter ATP-binding protein [Pacificimonas sp.]
MLVAEGVSVRVGGKALVSDASFHLKAGALVALVGPNGAGKSSLLRALAGVMPFEGNVRLGDTDWRALSPRERATRLAYLPQERRVEWSIAVADLVALGRHPFRRRFAPQTEDDRTAVAAAMAAMDVRALADRRATTLSGGELARALTARALAVQAPVLLADEPVAALDPYHQLQVMGVLCAEAARGAAVLVVLHDLSLAARFCDRVLLMDRGRIVADGSPREALSPAAVAATYGVEMLTGESGGEHWLLPWRALDRNG